MKPDGSGERVLTEGFHNEGPTWAPNGRVLMFFRESPGAAGGPKLYTIDLTGYNERPGCDPRFRLRSRLVAAHQLAAECGGLALPQSGARAAPFLAKNRAASGGVCVPKATVF